MILKCKKNLEIQTASKEYAKYFYEWWNNGELMKSVGFPNGLNNSYEVIVEKLGYLESEKTRKLFIIKDLDSNKYIGELSYSHLNIDLNSCEIGIKICEIDMHAKGYGYEALTGFIDFLNKVHGVTIFKLDVLANNNAAIKLYEKIGFKKLKINERAWTNEEGTAFDSIEYEYKI